MLTLPATLRFAHLADRARLGLHARAWLAVWLIALATLAPTLTQALAAAQGPGHGLEVCTSSGPRTLAPDGSLDLAADAGAAQGDGHPAPASLAGGHCPLCLLSHGSLAPPSATACKVRANAGLVSVLPVTGNCPFGINTLRHPDKVCNSAWVNWSQLASRSVTG